MKRPRVGIVSVWCNRGQAVVSRYIRQIFEEAGHETFVLARPTNEASVIAGHIDDDAVWQVPRLTHGSSFEMPAKEYLAWARETGIDVVFCDMNMQFKEIEALRDAGVRTIGRFVWERVRAEHAPRMRRAYDVVYSLTRAEQGRYREEFGIDSPFVRLGVFPDLIGTGAPKRDGAIWFIFHGGLQGPRKPLAATIAAFSAVKAPGIRLIIKSQAVRDDSEPVDIGHDPRILHVVDDMAFDEYHRFYSSCHVSLAPARWEGLGVHLYESLAYGMPVISNDIPPINEVIADGRSGLLVRSRQIGVRPGGVPIFDPDPSHLRDCIEALADPARLESMAATTLEEAARFDFANTRADYLALARR